MGLLTERDGAGDGYEEVTIPLVPVEAVGRGRAAECAAADSAQSNGFASGSGAEDDDRAEDGFADDSAARDSAPKDSAAEDSATKDIAAEDDAAKGDAAKGAAAKGAAAKGAAARSAAAEDGAAREGAARRGLVPGGGVMLRRRSALPTRRSVLYLHCERDPFVPEDLVSWYTERGFHFYVVDLRPEEALDKPARHRARPGQGERLARIDAACRHLRDTEGIDMIVVSAHAAGALTAALWCDARRDAGLADALILSRPAFARRLRRGLDIACPVLVLSPAEGQRRRAVGRSKAAGRSKNAEAVRLGPHVTWLRLEDGLDGQTRGPQAGRRQFFDQLGRWLGAYMYGSIRDQLL
jgi:hypothetical protein